MGCCFCLYNTNNNNSSSSNRSSTNRNRREREQESNPNHHHYHHDDEAEHETQLSGQVTWPHPKPLYPSGILWSFSSDRVALFAALHRPNGLTPDIGGCIQ